MGGGHRKFRVGARLRKLVGTYPKAKDLLEAAEVGKLEKATLARLWVSEGIPFAFKKCPGLYEEARRWLAERVEVDPKDISLAGSGRLGYSLAPTRWGQSYHPTSSDLDFFAVSESLFEGLREDFERWSEDFRTGSIHPYPSERQYWEANEKETPRNIARGFLDSKRVPNRGRYGRFRQLNGSLAVLKIKLHQFEGGPKPSGRLTLRCYRNWPAFERQLSINLSSAVKRTQKA